VGAASDIYSIGVVLYEFLIGRPPLVSDNTMQTLRLVNEVEPLAPRLILRGIPRDLDTICMKCLRKDPSERYGSAKELADDIERFLENRPILARPIAPALKVYRWCNRNLALAVSLFGILTLLTLLLHWPSLLRFCRTTCDKSWKPRPRFTKTLPQKLVLKATRFVPFSFLVSARYRILQAILTTCKTIATL